MTEWDVKQVVLLFSLARLSFSSGRRAISMRVGWKGKKEDESEGGYGLHLLQIDYIVYICYLPYLPLLLLFWLRYFG